MRKCIHCLAEVTLMPVPNSDPPRQAWSDGRRHPFYCPKALRMEHSVEDFDRYCDEHAIQPGEEPAAFAAYLNQQTGWDGGVRAVCSCPQPEGRACSVHGPGPVDGREPS